MARVVVRTRLLPPVTIDLATGKADPSSGELGKIAGAILAPAVDVSGPIALRVAPWGDPGSQWIVTVGVVAAVLALAVVALRRI